MRIYWRDIGEILLRYWRDIGELLGRYWRDIDEILERWEDARGITAYTICFFSKILKATKYFA